MMPNTETPDGMLREKAANVTALAVSQENMAKDHDKQAAACRDLAQGLRAKAKAFTDAADMLAKEADHETRRQQALKEKSNAA